MKIIKKSIIKDERNYWDITVPINHNFVLSNGALVHNCGSGVGFSVERQAVSRLPAVSEDFHETDTVIKVRDSKIGWSSAFRELIAMLYSGQVPKWDLTALRPAGAPLKTFGGRSSGPTPLEELFKFTVRVFRNAAGRKLQSIECHDILNSIASAIVVGGVRRSAQISLSNLSDDRMRSAKNGQWWIDNPQRALANNSVAYTEKPDMGVFMQEWKSLYESKSGERGIFNRQAALHKIKKLGRRDAKKAEEMFLGANPCCVSGDMIVDIKLNEIEYRMTVDDAVALYERGDDIYIRSFNLEKNEAEFNQVTTATLTRNNAKILKITDTKTNKFIRVTEDHLVYTKNRGYIMAKDIKPDDELLIG